MVEICDPILPQWSFPFLPPSFQKVFPREIRNLPAHKANWLLLSQGDFNCWIGHKGTCAWNGQLCRHFPKVCHHHCLFLTSQGADPALPISTLASLPAGLPLPSLLTLSAREASCPQGRSTECLHPEYVLSEKLGMEAKARKSPLMAKCLPLCQALNSSALKYPQSSDLFKGPLALCHSQAQTLGVAPETMSEPRSAGQTAPHHIAPDPV